MLVLLLGTLHLQAAQQGRAPWSLSFSYGRALQASVLKLWSEDRSKTAEAQAMAVALARANSAAARGVYEGPHPSVTSSAAGSLTENFRGWRSGELQQQQELQLQAA
jgi:fructose-bisphosphate aldolase class I